MIVRDGAANMRVGCAAIPLPSSHCVIHLLQLVVKDAIFADEAYFNGVQKCRVLVSFLHKSPRATAAFRRKQVAVNNHPLSSAKQLVGDLVTRWNSTYLMFRRIALLEEPLKDFMSEEEEYNDSTWSSEKTLDANDFDLINCMITVLAPFFELTEIMSSNKLSIALAIPSIGWLKGKLKKITNVRVNAMKKILLDTIQTRFYSKQPCKRSGQVHYNLPSDPRFSLPTLLHPALKLRPFTKKSNQQKVKQEFQDAVTALAVKHDEERRMEESNQSIVFLCLYQSISL